MEKRKVLTSCQARSSLQRAALPAAVLLQGGESRVVAEDLEKKMLCSMLLLRLLLPHYARS